ncbi:MAG: M28 family metallopeptidase [Pirellulaceae bacterium]
MKDPFIARVLGEIDQQRMRDDVFYLAHNPLPMRKANLTVPDHAKSTLEEADDFLAQRLEACAYTVRREGVRVQAFRCDANKPKAHQYSAPAPEDPWYLANNLLAERRGKTRPNEIILLLAHKDSQSWVHSPGAYDNAVGTVAVLELARVIARLEPQCTIRFLFCNEEHTPWTSVMAANNMRQRGDNLLAVFNLDSLGGKSQADIDAGAKTNVTLYTVDEGKALADLMIEVNEAYAIGLRQSVVKRSAPGDDDGSFVAAGYGKAVVSLGSFPYADPEYHREGDVPERVDYENARLTTQATLAAILHVDQSAV